MLIAQAVYAIKLFKGIEINDSIIDEVYDKLYKEKQNIVFIGMPSSGKTIIGSLIAKRLNRDFFDCDKEIEKLINTSIFDFIRTNGEKRFRDLESEVLVNLSKQNGIVISTGGGAILNKNNINNLKQNGFIIFIDRPLELLTPTSDRPLTSTINDLKKKYDERIDLYEAYNDLKVVNDKSLDECIDKILGGILWEY